MAGLLIVEDERITRENLQSYYDWSSIGINCVKTAGDGREAIELLKDYKPDVVITDIKMPFLDGIQLSEILEKQNKDILVIVISAYTETEYFKKAIKLKVFDYILKPIDRQELLNTVKNAVDYLSNRSEYREVAKYVKKTKTDLISQALSGSSNSDASENQIGTKQESLLIKRIKELVDSNYMLSEFSVSAISQKLNYTSSYICMVFKKHMNITLNEYITLIRIENAKLLLGDISLKLYDTSNLVGFSDENYFSKVFKKYVGMTPAAYRKKGGQ